MPFTENLAVFFDPSEFASAASYTPAGSSDPPVTVNGIFDNGFESALDAPGLAESQPLFTCRSADVPAVAAGDLFTIAGTGYLVAGPPRPDGQGVVHLRLREAT